MSFLANTSLFREFTCNHYQYNNTVLGLAMMRIIMATPIGDPSTKIDSQMSMLDREA